MLAESSKIWDLIGVGMGPANLALAVIAEEEGKSLGNNQPEVLFLEQKKEMGWHPDMMIPNATIQVSFLKDLVTLRNPCSQFTFLNYLREKNRLNEFVNLQSFFPCRRELNDYFMWAADKLSLPVHYGKEVIQILPVSYSGEKVELLEVVVRDLQTNNTESYLTRDIVIATGGRPKVPTDIDVKLGDRIFHSSRLLSTIREQYPDINHPYRFVVVGSGQSSAEVFHYLANRFPNATVKATLRSFAYQPMDDSSFINEVFFPEHVNFFYQLSEEQRQEFLLKYRTTNYSVVDLELIKKIYELVYNDKFFGENRLEILPFHSLDSAKEVGGCVNTQFIHALDEKVIELECDGLLLATGYDHGNQSPLLDKVANYLFRTERGDYQIERSYCLTSYPEFMPRIFLQGLCEETHGLSDTLLSILPVRAEEIWKELLNTPKEVCEPTNLLMRQEYSIH